MSRKITFMRGLPGSGKSETARALKARYQALCVEHDPAWHGAAEGFTIESFVVLLSTDDYFTTGGGDYKFVPEEIAKAHEWNQARALEAMELGVPLIIIDNTMTQWWEAEPYVTPALARSYEVDFVEPDTPWAKDVEECAKRTTHGVPIEAIQAMADRWEDDLASHLVEDPPGVLNYPTEDRIDCVSSQRVSAGLDQPTEVELDEMGRLASGLPPKGNDLDNDDTNA